MASNPDTRAIDEEMSSTDPYPRVEPEPETTNEPVLDFVASPDETLQSVSVQVSGRLLVGRHPPDSARGLPVRDRRMSATHFEVVRSEEGLVLRDQGSSNGTFVDGAKVVSPVALSYGDVVRAGDTLAVVADSRRGDDDPIPPLQHMHARGRAIRRVLRTVSRVAGASTSVLILGEPGVGKEGIATALHLWSQRKGALVAVNCASLRRELQESELFGHTKGAFTSAVSSHGGLFSRAERGTLFLDEVGRLTPSAQATLLRALESRRVRPVGASIEHDVDVRFIAATNEDLDSLLATGEFRADLLGRLDVVRIPVPPLRRRRDEILPLLCEFLGARYKLDVLLSEAFLLASWPRNVRGLRHLAENIKGFYPVGQHLDFTHMQPDWWRFVGQTTATDTESPREGPSGSPKSKAVLQSMLAQHGGNVSSVARALGYDRTTVYRWIQRQGLDPSSFRSGGDST